MNQKLFKKLNEQVEINTIKRVELTEAEKKAIETKIIFEDFVKETDELLRVEDDSLSLKEDSENFFSETLLLEFKEFLAEEGDSDLLELNEDVLNEGKLWNKIRWKLAKFSLGFLKESSINEFLMAYYADKNGKPTEKGKEWISKKKKEKVKKLRELAENLKEEEKQKVIQSEPAKQMERQAIKSGIFAGVAGIGAGVAHTYAQRAGDIEKIAKNASFQTGVMKDGKIISSSNPNAEGLDTYITKGVPYGDADKDFFKTGNRLSYEKVDYDTGLTINGVPHKMKDDAGILVAGEEKYNHGPFSSYKLGGFITTALSALTTILFGAMWGSLIVAGVQGVKAGYHAHKANVMRREEILQQLMAAKKQE